MTDATFTALALVVDRSGSMKDILVEAEGALNSFITDQKAQPGRATVRYVRFDTQIETVFVSKPLEEVSELKIQPRGLTALRDAIATTIIDLGEELAALPEDERPGQVVVVILTDGLENASREYSSDAVKELIEKQTNDYNWTFVFLAANQDAVLTASEFGIAKGGALTFNTTEAGLENTSANLSSYVNATRAGKSYKFSDEERLRSMY